MKIGLPKEVKNNEFRVGLTPDSVGELSLNHKVFVQKNAGKAIGFTDEMYQANGAQILEKAKSKSQAKKPRKRRTTKKAETVETVDADA